MTMEEPNSEREVRPVEGTNQGECSVEITVKDQLICKQYTNEVKLPIKICMIKISDKDKTICRNRQENELHNGLKRYMKRKRDEIYSGESNKKRNKPLKKTK